MADVKQPIEMDITEVVKATGIASSAIRYYEKKGLIILLIAIKLRKHLPVTAQ